MFRAGSVMIRCMGEAAESAFFEAHHVFHMVGVGEHVDRLHGCDLIKAVESGKVAGLSGRITAHIHDSFGSGVEYDFDYIVVHAGSRGVDNHNIRTPMCGD